uniref:Uncharacterized protein n=1 Tax=Anguilla anguilla TaxID=7936 RepID=A0A0E9X4Q2_ANGAN
MYWKYVKFAKYSIKFTKAIKSVDFVVALDKLSEVSAFQIKQSLVCVWSNLCTCTYTAHIRDV